MALTDEDKQCFLEVLSQNHGIENTGQLAQDMLREFENSGMSVDDLKSAIREPKVVLNRNVDERLKGFTKQPDNEYNGGYDLDIIALVNREKAANNPKVTFVDPDKISNKNDLKAQIAAQSGKTNDVLLTATASVLNERSSKEVGRFLESLKSEAKNYKKVVIPIACLDEPGVSVGHAITLVLDPQKKEAAIIDQMGNPNDAMRQYPKNKEELEKKIQNVLGYTVKYNEKPLTKKNYCDCACVASMVANDVIAGKELGYFTENVYEGKVDANHKIDKDLASSALMDMYVRSPVFKLYCKAKGISFDMLSPSQKMAVIDGFSLFNEGTLVQDVSTAENVPANDNQLPPISDTAKAAIKPKVERLFQEKGREFEEYNDPEHPEALCYRHADGSKIRFTDVNQGWIESKNYEDFDIVCKVGKQNGCKNVDFGPYFQEHLDEGALLYLAALKNGMKVKNAPDVEMFKDVAPAQYVEIKKILLTEQLKADKEAKKVAGDAWKNSVEGQSLEQTLETKKKACKDMLTVPETKSDGSSDMRMVDAWSLHESYMDQLKDAQQQIFNLKQKEQRSDGEEKEFKHQKKRARVLKALAGRKKRQMLELKKEEPFKEKFDAYEAAKKARDEHPDYKASREAEASYRAHMEEAVKVAIYSDTNEERVEKLMKLQAQNLEREGSETESDFARRQQYQYRERRAGETEEDYTKRKEAFDERLQETRKRLVRDAPAVAGNRSKQDDFIRQVALNMARNNRSPL